MLEIGKYYKLGIIEPTLEGLYLGDEKGNEILLPDEYCPEHFTLSDKLDVFVYKNNEGKRIATTHAPKVVLHEFALLKVKAVAEVGTFMDWGLDKDLMVPFKEQIQKMEEGRWYIVYLDIDEKTDRLYGSNKIEKFIQNENLDVEEGEEVDLLVWKKTELGYSVIVNNKHAGLVFKNEIFQELNVGDKLKGFVKKIREDKKIDISIQPLGYKQAIDPHMDMVFKILEENDGFMEITDKSPPEEISALFGMSKKAFKKAIGALYKQRKIDIQEKGIQLV
jgi:predicted RNA-binding protein (virulence factor B family)